MKPFAEYKSEPRQEKFPQLPAGAYVCTIQNVKEDGEYPDDSLVLRLEIAEGEYAGYYGKRYRHDEEASRTAGFKPRYKGDFRIRAPRAENPHIRNLEWAIRSFNNAIWSIEDSNEGYHFDFGNVAALKGKQVGVSVREASFQGAAYTEIGRLESARQVRDGKVRPMRPREDRSGSAPAASSPAFTPVEPDDDFPF